MRSLISLLLTLGLFTSLAYAVIPVHDAGLIWATELNHYQTILRWVEQIKQATETVAQAKKAHAYRVKIDGAWKSALGRMGQYNHDSFCNVPQELKELGWPDRSKFENVAAVRGAVKSLDDFKKLVEMRNHTRVGYAAREAQPRTRQTMETLWGEVPVTREGIKVESAYRELAQVTDSIGNLSSAVEENKINLTNLALNISSGAFTPVELERKKAQIQVEQARSSLLQVHSNNLLARLLIQQTGMQAGGIVQSEQARLRGIERMQTWMGQVQFSPKASALRGVD